MLVLYICNIILLLLLLFASRQVVFVWIKDVRCVCPGLGCVCTFYSVKPFLNIISALSHGKKQKVLLWCSHCIKHWQLICWPLTRWCNPGEVWNQGLPQRSSRRKAGVRTFLLLLHILLKLDEGSVLFIYHLKHVWQGLSSLQCLCPLRSFHFGIHSKCAVQWGPSLPLQLND